MAVALTLALVLAVGSALAQTYPAQGNLGVYADPLGTTSSVRPTQGQPFDIYVVLFTEDVVDAVGYKITFPPDYALMAQSYGPDGSGLNIDVQGGSNVGLGTCAVGFGGLPIVAARYTLVYVGTTGGQQPMITLEPLPREGSLLYSTCQSVLKAPELGPSLILEDPVPTQEESWGAVKSLYGN
jgi:hypothetical protein